MAAMVDAALGLFPPVRTSTVTLRLAMERRADEKAAGAGVEGRQSVRDALLSVAAAMVVAPEIAGFSATVGSLGERVRALEADPPTPCRSARVAVWSPTLGLAVLSLATLGVWLGHALMMLAVTGLCQA